MRTARGFTLLEVLVALAIIAFALGSTIKVAGSGAANASYLRDKTFAHWVASNRFAQMQIRDNPWPRKGGDEGAVEMAGREWFWATQVSDTQFPNMRRVDVTVRLDDDEDLPSITTLTGFIAKPPSRAPANNDPGAGDPSESGDPSEPGDPQDDGDSTEQGDPV